MYACIWEYRVTPAMQHRFEAAYGPAGSWVALFRRASGYVETRLYRDRDDPGRYVTVDAWESPEAYDAFRRDFGAEYERIDTECAALTLGELLLGHFAVPES